MTTRCRPKMLMCACVRSLLAHCRHHFIGLLCFRSDVEPSSLARSAGVEKRVRRLSVVSIFRVSLIGTGLWASSAGWPPHEHGKASRKDLPPPEWKEDRARERGVCTTVNNVPCLTSDKVMMNIFRLSSISRGRLAVLVFAACPASVGCFLPRPGTQPAEVWYGRVRFLLLFTTASTSCTERRCSYRAIRGFY